MSRRIARSLSVSSPRNSATYRMGAASVSICRPLAVTLARSAWAGGCQIASGVPLKSSARSTLMSTPKPSFSGSPFFSGSMSRFQISSYIGPDL